MLPSKEHIVEAIRDFVNAETWEESRRIVEERHKVLLTDVADQVFADLLQEYQGDENVVHNLIKHRDLLVRCRIEGIDAVFATQMNPNEEINEQIIVIILSFVNASTWAESKRIVEKHRNELLSDTADQAFEILLARYRGDRGTADTLLEYRTLLTRCRSEGVENAFADRLPPPVPSTIPPELQAQLHMASILPTLLNEGNEVAKANIRYQTTGDIAALDEAVAACDRILSQTAFDSASEEFKSLTQKDAGKVLWQRYEERGLSDDLDRAIHLWQRALPHIRCDSPEYPGLLKDLGVALRSRYGHTGKLVDLEEAVAYLQQAVQRLPQDSSTLSVYFNSLGNALRDLYLYHTGAMEDLNRCISCFERAVACTLPGESNFPAHFNNLANALRERYECTGALTDLEGSIARLQQALESTSPSSPHLFGILSNMGMALRARYERTGSLADLDETITYLRQALQHTPSDLSRLNMLSLPGMLSNLGVSLRNRYNRTGMLVDLNESINSLRQAIERTPHDSPLRPGFLNNLGTSLRYRYERGQNLADLDKSIEFLQQAVEYTSPDSPGFAGRLNNLGSSLLNRYLHAGKLVDLDKAVTCFEEALQHTLPDSPDRPMYLNSLGAGLINRFEHTRNTVDMEKAVRHFQEACDQGMKSAIETALGSSRNWGSWALERAAWKEASEAFSYGLQAIERLFRTQLLRTSKETWLRDAQGLPAQAAYAYARVGDFRSAVLTLEIGQARLLSEALERDRADLQALERSNPKLIQRYQEVTNLIAVLQRQELRNSSTMQGLTKQMRLAYHDLDTVIQEIQQVDGHQDFLAAPGIDDIAKAVQVDHPIVYLVTTLVGSLALVVSSADNAERVTIEPVWSDHFTATELDTLLVKREGSQVVSGYITGQLTTQGLTMTLNEILPLLGEQLIGPIAEKLRQLKAKGLILIAGGHLGLLPLHAARYSLGSHDLCLLDEFEVTYAPSARVFTTAQQALSIREEIPPLLVGVGNPMENPRPLLYARPELEEVATLFPEGARHVLYEREATKDALLAALPGATYVHLSCHGTFDPEEPLNSRLQLADDMVFTLREVLASNHFEHARLVVLSACQTAVTDFSRLPDEAIGLPAGFFQAGVSGVVGTLWPVNDLATMLLMVKFYKYHLRSESDGEKGQMLPTQALRKAQLWLRDVTNAELSELFRAYEQAAPDATESSRMAYALARKKFREHTLRQAGERPFAHPYYWAAFAFYGV
jgi:CHAT domain-containing protein/TPR repeat protein